MTLFMPLVATFLSLTAVAEDRPRAMPAPAMPAPIVCDEQVVCHQSNVARLDVAEARSVRDRTDPRRMAGHAPAMPVPPHFQPRNPP